MQWPTVEALSQATEEEVKSAWAGLGYYRRSRNLHQGAKYVMENHKGQVPNKYAELIKVQGVGRYTAGAILSIAYEQDLPVVDGNVLRVFSRLGAVKSTPQDTQFIKHSWTLAQELVKDSPSPGDWNQALMELGATVCKKANPECGTCPVKGRLVSIVLLDSL